MVSEEARRRHELAEDNQKLELELDDLKNRLEIQNEVHSILKQRLAQIASNQVIFYLQ
jgi:hypothetical protein